jgi:hypothetical protein
VPLQMVILVLVCMEQATLVRATLLSIQISILMNAKHAIQLVLIAFDLVVHHAVVVRIYIPSTSMRPAHVLPTLITIVFLTSVMVVLVILTIL